MTYVEVFIRGFLCVLAVTMLVACSGDENSEINQSTDDLVTGTYSYNPGTGQLDMTVLTSQALTEVPVGDIPITNRFPCNMDLFILESMFSGMDTDYIVFYTEYGNADFGADSGFEEWRYLAKTTSVPEPASIALMGLGLLGIGAAACRRKQS